MVYFNKRRDKMRIPSVLVFYYLLVDEMPNEHEIDVYDQQLMSVIRSYMLQGYIVNNFQDKI